MEIIDKFKSEDSTHKFSAIKIYPAESCIESDENIVSEHVLEVRINTISTYKIVCSPQKLPQLVVGRLKSDGTISSTDEIDQIYICEYGNRADVLLKDSKRANFTKKHTQLVQSCCTGNKKFNSFFDSEEDIEKVLPIDVDKNLIFKMADFFSQDSPTHKKSFGVHSCYLATREMLENNKMPIVCEDLGRHNALDKAIGSALINHINLQNCLIFTTGRVPIDMLEKVLRSKIPVLITKAVPTTSTIELAKQFDLTLVCSAYPDSALVFNDPLSLLKG